MEMVNLIVSLNRYRSKFITQFIPIYTLLYYYLVYIYIYFLLLDEISIRKIFIDV